MSVAATILVYAGIPLLAVLVLAALIIPGGRRRPKWRSGQEWPHPPVWFEPHPETEPDDDDDVDLHAATSAIGAGVSPAAITSGQPTAPEPGVGGPLGGARGTW